MDVSGTSVFNNLVTIKDDVTVYGNVDISGNLDVSGTSVFNNLVTIKDDVTVYGNVDISGNLDVSGTSVFNSGVIINNTLDVCGNVTMYNDLDICGNLIVYATSVFNSGVTTNDTLDVCGNITMYKNAKVYGNLDISNNLDVSGTSVFNGEVTINDSITFNDGTTQYTAYTGSTTTSFSPPAVNISSSSSSTSILFTWTIPTYQVSSSGSPFAYTLTNIFAYLYADIQSTTYNSYNLLPTDASGYIYDVSAIVISNNSSSTQSGYVQNYNCIDGTTRNVFYYYNSDFKNMSYSQYNQLTLWYTNNYPYPNVGDASYNVFLTAGTPSDVSFNPFTQTSPNNITLHCYVTAIDTSNANTTASLQSYKISAYGYDSSGSAIRYPSPLPDYGYSKDISTNATTGTGTGSTSDTSFNLGSSYYPNAPIFPSSTYSFYVAAQNNSNTNYGPSSEYIVSKTANLPKPSSSITSPLFNPTSLTYTNNNNIYLVSTKSLVTSNVVNINSVKTSNNFTSSTFSTSVQTTSNLGLTDGSNNQSNTYLTITADISNATYSNNHKTCYQNIHGFDTSLSSANPYYYNGYKDVSNGITVTTIVSDYYTKPGDPSCNQGFYLMANPVMNISASILTPTNNLYTATLTTVQKITSGQTVTDGSSNSSTYNFYSDGVTTVPTYGGLGSFSLKTANANSCSKQVSGIWVINSNPTLTITDLSLSNMGDYFYRSPLVIYDFSGGVIGSAKEVGINNVSGKSDVSLNSTINITNDISGTFVQKYNNNITLYDISYQNISSSNYQLLNRRINVIVDPSSASLASAINPTSIPKLTSSYSTGYRVWSASSLTTNDPSGIVPYLYISNGSYIPNGTNAQTNVGYSTVPYDNSWNISLSSTTYGVSSELLIANGYFTTSSTYYLNYATDFSGGVNNTVNYSPSNMYTSGYRYATFAWDMSSSTSGITVSLIFNNTMYLNNIGYVYFDQSATSLPLQLVYRFGDTQNTATFGPTLTGDYYPNTTWINLNSTAGTSLNGTNAYSPTLNALYNAPTISPAQTQGLLVTPVSAGNTISYTTTTFPQSIATISDDTIYLYVRIGIPSGTYGFNNVKALCSF